MGEKDVEKYLKDEVEALGGIARKWSSPQHSSVPDRIVVIPGEVWFIEVKNHGKLPTDAQWREIFRLKLLGANAGYLSSEREIDQFLATPDRKLWMENHIKNAKAL